MMVNIELWPAQTWISLMSAVVSVIGASVTLYWTRRRMQWDAGRELGELRREAITLISYTRNLEHANWSVGYLFFSEALIAWEGALLARQPLISSKAYAIMEELSNALHAARSEVFGRIRVYSDDPEEQPEIIGEVADETTENLERIAKLLADPHFLIR